MAFDLCGTNNTADCIQQQWNRIVCLGEKSICCCCGAAIAAIIRRNVMDALCIRQCAVPWILGCVFLSFFDTIYARFPLAFSDRVQLFPQHHHPLNARVLCPACAQYVAHMRLFDAIVCQSMSQQLDARALHGNAPNGALPFPTFESFDVDSRCAGCKFEIGSKLDMNQNWAKFMVIRVSCNTWSRKHFPLKLKENWCPWNAPTIDATIWIGGNGW